MKSKRSQRRKWAGTGTALVATFFMAGYAFAAEPPAKKVGEFEEDDGTYAVEIVTSIEACRALCEADKDNCKGTVVYQEDITKLEMQCRLNNGFGANAAFPHVEPEALDYDIAIAELNEYRISKGLSALTYDERLNSTAELHAEDIASAGILSHTGTNGSSLGDRVQLQGYYFSTASENAASGQTSWDAAFKSWKNSPGHNENMLRDDVSELGLAFVSEPTSKLQTYWVMVLADPVDIDSLPLIEALPQDESLAVKTEK